MATSIKLKSDIKKIEAAIKSKATPKSLVPKLQAQLEKIKDELASLNSPKPKKGVTKTKVLSSLQKLKAKVKSTKSLAGYKNKIAGKRVDLKKDAEVPALPLGKRYAQTTGTPYYEYRLNRADVKQPPKRYPKLEDGGMMDKGGIYPSDDRWVVTFQDQDSGEFEKVIVRANNKKSAIDVAEDESGLSSNWQYYSAEKEMANGGMMASGGRLKSAVNRDRAYKSDEAWEQSYKRKSRPKNPKYDTSDKGIFEKGGYMAMGGALEHGLMVGDVVKGMDGNNIAIYNTGDENSYMVDISKGKREMLSNMSFDKYAQGGELHRLEQGM